MAIRNIKLIIAYDGSSYSGWQRQPDTPTIQQTVEEALERLCGFAVKVNGASRTDAGVSALGQTANIKLESPVPTENFPRAITQMLPDEIAIVSAEEVTRFSLVITSSMRVSFDSRKRRSLLVKIPFSSPFCVIGTPPMFLSSIMRTASPTCWRRASPRAIRSARSRS